jgi:hypothetical protein
MQLNSSLGRIIGSCDVMVTPVHDLEWATWGLEQTAYDTKGFGYTDYGASGFKEYLSRGWCRLEMFFNANMPCNLMRNRLFGGLLQRVMIMEKRRPHLVYGSREHDLDMMPIVLPVLKDEEFANYHPGRGRFFDKRDAVLINRYIQELFQINSELIRYADI